jgi:hypothetical protein
MSIREAREQMKQAQRHLEAAAKAIESASPAILPYVPRVGDVIRVESCGEAFASIVVQAGSWIKVYLDLDISKPIVFSSISKVAQSVRFLRRATPAEMGSAGIIENDVAYAYAPEIGHLVQYCEDGINVRQGAVIAVDGVRTTIRVVNSTEAGLLDSVPRSSDWCLSFIRYATGEEMGIKAGEPSPIWMPRNYESWMLADNYPMVARDGETTYLAKRSASSLSWTVEIERGLGSTIRAYCDDKAQAMDVAQAMAGKTLEWRRWF